MVKAAKKRSERNTDITRTDVVVGIICGLFFLSVIAMLLLPYITDWQKFSTLKSSTSSFSDVLNRSEGSLVSYASQSCSKPNTVFDDGTIYCTVSVNSQHIVASVAEAKEKVSLLENTIQRDNSFERLNSTSIYTELSLEKEITSSEDERGGTSYYKLVGTDVTCSIHYSLGHYDYADYSLKSLLICRDKALSEHFSRSDT